MLKAIWIAVLSLAIVGCAEPTRTELKGSVAVSFSTRAAIGTPNARFAAAPAFTDTIVVGSDTLVITSAKVVLREIELELATTATCDVEPEPAGCEEVEVGPVLVDLPLTPGALKKFEVDIPPGSYGEVEFEIHKVSGGDPADAAFIQANPEFADLSMRVVGTFNGTPFVYTSDLNVDQELSLFPPVVVTDSAGASITIFVDVRTWFRDAGGALIDPATANKGGPNENAVKTNIEASFRAFEDADRDGDELDG